MVSIILLDHDPFMEYNIIMLKNGDIVHNRYRIESLLGEGGMSTVYRVKDLTLDSVWAMKETLDIFPDRDKSDIIDQFKKEAKILANLSHPGLPRVIDYFVEKGQHYLVEEMIHGKSVSEILEENGAFNEYRMLNWALQVCDLLEFLHNNSIIYRDLKPGNIMVDGRETVYLVDFGIARFFQGGKQKDTVIIGTPGFASPEHYGRGETDRRSDIYSLGATLHYMMTGRDPADKPFHFEIPYMINSGVSFQTSAIIMKCLDLDPIRRYQSAMEVKIAIRDQAIPSLTKGTRMLQQKNIISRPERYRNSTDIMGMATQVLSYLSIFPLSMGISGVTAMFLSFANPIVGIGGGIVSFPILCLEFWKRLDQVYKNQDILIEARKRGISYRSRKLNLKTDWLQVVEVRLIKNNLSLLGRNVKEVKVLSGAGEFSFDASFGNYRRLVDVIVTQAGLGLAEENSEEIVYRKV